MLSRCHSKKSRTGFTLVELLVVMIIIAILAALLIGFLPSMFTQTAEANGAINLQGWLQVARQKAVRNQSPFGLRFWIKDTTTNWVTECQYIEQPDDFVAVPNGTITTQGVNNDTINFAGGVDLAGGFGATGDPSLFPVQVGDYLEVLGTGLMHRVTSVTLANPSTALTLATGLPYPITNGTSNWRIVRQPRVVGEETLTMPGGVVVDLGANGANAGWPQAQLPNFVAAGTGAYLDVLFSPSGSLIVSNSSAQVDTMVFWVRLPDTRPGNSNNLFFGTPTLIAVWARTGFVGAYAPVPGNGVNPYLDVK